MPSFIYQREAEVLAKSINNGQLKQGDRLLSVRDFARERKVGISTAAKIYEHLQRQQLIEARPRSGYYVCARQQSTAQQNFGDKLIPSELISMPLHKAVQYSFNDADIVPLSCTGPSTVLDNEALLTRAQKRVRRQRPFKLLQDNREAGIDSLRQEIATHYALSQQLINPAEVVITHGRSSALTLALKGLGLSEHKVAVESPSSFFILAHLHHSAQAYVGVPIQPDFETELALLEQARQEHDIRAYIFNPNYQDPTGRLLSEQQKRALLAWAQRHDVALIEYDRGELSFSEFRPPSIASLLDEDSSLAVISICDYSDTLSFALTLGYMLCRNCAADIILTKSVLSEASDIASQELVTHLYRSGDYRRLIRRLRAQLLRQYQQVDEIFNHFGVAHLYQDIGGGPSLWFELPQGGCSDELWQRLITRRIAIAPGELFMPQIDYARFFRMTFALPWEKTMAQAVHTLAQQLSSYIHEL
ncbi:PLP-dependent aminotransferase family protein [Pseudoalteromonas sp. Cnat2-41]|uniref:aminotransferase-like domain-containing protein n=1 Tax=unclassified Pseudoalteromonas TaxID=194690 RepID=UPI001EF8E71C|nr:MULTISPECIES: PLP-dependent aminotransferase family protein [unclassified Pseudoalteromonas]MCF2863843.1 PLP-dependent aminotransferase family protein [Pseudoalteromonas sp. CNAT2-18]MCG7559764.1 PLP-dependent aminotransferase family protein [Pseudoalteromonas sp. CNAT2-18.1]